MTMILVAIGLTVRAQPLCVKSGYGTVTSVWYAAEEYRSLETACGEPGRRWRDGAMQSSHASVSTTIKIYAESRDAEIPRLATFRRSKYELSRRHTALAVAAVLSCVLVRPLRGHPLPPR